MPKTDAELPSNPPAPAAGNATASGNQPGATADPLLRAIKAIDALMQKIQIASADSDKTQKSKKAGRAALNIADADVSELNEVLAALRALAGPRTGEGPRDRLCLSQRDLELIFSAIRVAAGPVRRGGESDSPSPAPINPGKKSTDN